MAGQFLIVMDGDGRLWTLTRSQAWKRIVHFERYDLNSVGARDMQGNPVTLDLTPYRFTGSECFTADCLPAWGVDAYYVDELPKTLQESCGR